MNIPHYTSHTSSIRRINNVVKTSNRTFLELLQLPIPELISKATSDTPIRTLILNKITLIRHLNLKISNNNIKLDKINNKFEKALNLRLRTLISLLNPEQSCRFLLNTNQDELFINNIANKILLNYDSSPIHYLAALSSIIYNNKLNLQTLSIGCKTKLQVLEESFINKISEIIDKNSNLDSSDLTYFLLLFSVYFAKITPNTTDKLLSDYLYSENNPNSLESIRPNNGLIESIVESISHKLLSVDIINPETTSLLLESIANIYDDKLPNLNLLLQKLLSVPLEGYLIGNTSEIKSPTILSRVLYGIYKTQSFNSPIFNQILTILKEDGLDKIRFNTPLELFRTSFSLIVSNQINNKNIFKWLLNESVRLSNQAIAYPSQFLFVLTGLSLSPNLIFPQGEKGSSISFDKTIYERAEADLNLLETGELSFNSDILSMKHLFSLAESLIPTINNNEFVQLLHAYCSSKLHFQRLVKIKLYSESIKRLPMLPLEALPQILRSSIWLLGIKSDETSRLAHAVSNRLIGELINSEPSLFVITELLILLDKCRVYSRELAISASIAFSKEKYQNFIELNFTNSIALLHYLSSSSITLSNKTSGELKEEEIEIARDFLFTKSIYEMKKQASSVDALVDYDYDSKINLDSVTNLLHSAHIKGEITRFTELINLSIALVNGNCISGTTGDSINEYIKILNAISEGVYKYTYDNGKYKIIEN